MLATTGEYTTQKRRGTAALGGGTALDTMSAMPTVNVRLFAGLKEMIGAREITLALPDGATIHELRACIGETYPLVKPLLSTTVCAVGEEYVPVTHLLRDGDLVALIPPVSGGR